MNRSLPLPRHGRMLRWASIFLALLLIAGTCVEAVGAKAKPAAAKRQLVPFDVSPFPYHGLIPGQDKPFMDLNVDGRLGHTAPRGGRLFEDEAYSDRRVLLYIPSGFDARKPAVMILFFHGNQALLDRDVDKRQGVLRQLAASKLNAVLVAPQFAANALDSSAGTFWLPETLPKFLDEAATRLAALEGGGVDRQLFASMPVVLVAYSGGYLPAAYSLAGGGADRRLAGLVLMDALYGEVEKFAAWIGRKPSSAFVLSAYSKSSSGPNNELIAQLKQGGVEPHTGGLSELSPGRVVFLPAGDTIVHNDFLTQAWVKDPLRAVFARIATFALPKRAALEPPAPVTKTAEAGVVPAVPAPAAVPVVPPAVVVPAPAAAVPVVAPAPAPTPVVPTPPGAIARLGAPGAPTTSVEQPKKLGAIEPAKSRPGVATGSPLTPVTYAIELVRGKTAADAKAKAVALKPECASLVGQYKAAIVAAEGGGFGVQVGPFNAADFNTICGKLESAKCPCNPIEVTLAPTP